MVANLYKGWWHGGGGGDNGDGNIPNNAGIQFYWFEIVAP